MKNSATRREGNCGGDKRVQLKTAAMYQEF
jgi:hypothetical protein